MIGGSLLVVGAAFAQQPVELLQGPTALEPCRDQPLCIGVLTPLVSESLVEFGWFLQHDTLQGGALTGRGTGLVFEVHADTFTLNQRNIVTREAGDVPLIPKLEVGYQFGSYTYDDPFPQFAVSAFLFPPVSIDGYQLLNTGASTSVAVPVVTHVLWAGLEVGGQYARAEGEMLGDGQAIEDVALIAPFVDLENPPCDSEPLGCRDRLTQYSGVARLGLAIEPVPALFLYGKVGIALLETRFDVAYDSSRWRMGGWQPQASYGAGVRIEDRVTFTVGAVTAAKPEMISTDETRSITRLNLGLAVRTGQRRYWYEDVPSGEGPRADEPR